MARSIDEIQQAMLDDIANDETLSSKATNESKAAIFRLFTRIVATCAWVVENLFDAIKQEVNELIALFKPHTTRWYRRKALEFQYGFSLAPDSDTYDNTGFTQEQIDDSLIIKHAAVIEGQDQKLRIKVATEGGDDLEPLTDPQLEAFAQYMSLVKDAGVKIQVESNEPDQIKLDLKIYYDPLILTGEGERIDGTDDTPVQTAVKNYLKALPFNGVFVLAFLTDALQKVDGVVIPHIVECETKYAEFEFTPVEVMYLPDAGYLRFENDADLTIEFIPQGQIQ